MDRDDIRQLIEKINVLTTVMAAQIGTDLPLIERAPLLNRLGLDRTQIARVCGTRPEVVSVRLSEAKRGRKLKGFKRRGRDPNER